MCQIQAWRHTEGCDGGSASLNSAGSDRSTRVVRPLLKSLALMGGHDVLSGQDQVTCPLLEDPQGPRVGGGLSLERSGLPWPEEEGLADRQCLPQPGEAQRPGQDGGSRCNCWEKPGRGTLPGAEE